MMLLWSFYTRHQPCPHRFPEHRNAGEEVGRRHRVRDTSSYLGFTCEPKLTADELFQKKDMSKVYFPHQTRPLGSPARLK